LQDRDERGDDVSAHTRALEALQRWSAEARAARRQFLEETGSVGARDPAISSVEEVAGIHVVALAGIVDAYTAATLRSELLRLATEGKPLVVDLTDVTVIDSSGLSALLAASTALRERGRTLAVVAGNPHVMRGFELAGLDRLFRIEDSRAEALVERQGVAGGVA
jgi:anti-sigma B factor antagonist